MSSLEVLNHAQVFDQYRAQIETVHQAQRHASKQVVKALIAIGALCHEAKTYRDQLAVRNKEDLWRQFANRLPISKASISKYMAVANHPLLRQARYHHLLPPSIYTLYELTKLSPRRLNSLMKQRKIHPDLGRTELHRLLGTTPAKQRSTGTAEIEILRLKLPQRVWETKFDTFKDELLAFLDKRKIAYEYGSEIQRRERIETRYFQSIQKRTHRNLQIACKTCLRQYVETQGQRTQLFGKKPLAFSKKLALLKFSTDEVNFHECTSTDELQQKYLHLGLGTMHDWYALMQEALHEAHSHYEIPKHLRTPTNTSKLKTLTFEHLTKRPRKKRDFSGLKV